MINSKLDNALEILDIVKYLRLPITAKPSEESKWEEMSKIPLPEDFIRKNADKLNWDLISRYQKLSEVFIREFKSELDWYYISRNQKLSESFIREFQHRVSWSGVSEHQTLSEDFIIEFQNKVQWDKILKHQKVSDNFRKVFTEITRFSGPSLKIKP